jgi:hypothetical protein
MGPPLRVHRLEAGAADAPPPPPSPLKGEGDIRKEGGRGSPDMISLTSGP